MSGRRAAPVGSVAPACGAGMDSARNGIFFRSGQLLSESVERVAVREPPLEAGP